MSKHVRQYIGIFAALAVYYVVHEGAHLIAALIIGTFRELRFLGLGIQVDVNAESMTDTARDILHYRGVRHSYRGIRADISS